ncbi:MAG: cell division protein FtsH, partial [Candidatus Aminicenantes bacterium]|nr:cell division protein FtsH [Candidatus Aminicenantes bacterium]
GHALIAALLPEADPIHKVTIIPRGLALGLTQQLPIDDRYTHSKKYLEAQLSVLLGGRVAELLFLEKMTTGAANDFERGTEIARKMVCQYGMSDLGPLTFGERDDLIFLGKDLTMHKNFSEKTAERIDEEVKKIIDRNYARAEGILKSNKTTLINIAEALLEREILDSKEIKILLEGKKLPKNNAAAQKQKEPQTKPSKASKGEKRTAKPATAKA